jgi:hypothetical protein
MSITSGVTKNLLDELEASKQRRLRAWNVLQRLRLVRSEHGTVAIPPPAQKTFDAEGQSSLRLDWHSASEFTLIPYRD